MSIDRDILKSIPASAGVYLLKDKKGGSLYIGKAKNLKSRVSSYFNRGEDAQRPQISFLMREACDLEYFVTRDEREALLLENSLIKQKKPRYNIRLRDDKNYMSLKLNLKEEYPRLTLTRRVLKDGAVYYGPFASADAIKKAKRLIHKIFPLRDCTDGKFRRHSSRPCLSYYMGQCLGPCANKSDRTEYKNVADRAKMFMRGEKDSIMELLKEKMERASEDMRYEDAAHYRDQLRLLQKNMDAQMFVTPNTKDTDVLGFYREGDMAEFAVLFSRGGTLVDKNTYTLKKVAGEDSEMLEEFLTQFYGGNRFVPNNIVIPLETEGGAALSEWLTEKQGRKVSIGVPQKGEKLGLAELAGKNAAESFQRKHREQLEGVDLLERTKAALQLESVPASIECFDISNIQGSTAVASMVRFEDGKPAKDLYKRFRIKTVKGPNDYASMYEALSRRLDRAGEAGWDLPDLILVDGGKGQLNIARRVLEEIGLDEKTGLASIAKGRAEGESDKIYIYGRKNPVSLAEKSPVLFLLMRIRDEAHRFAITYHKKLRGRGSLRSELDDVPGVGAKRKKALIKRFGSVSRIGEASVEEISSVPGISPALAEELKRRLSL